MRQRVVIAMALACNPDLVIADEPTTALDVTIQAQILELMGALRDQFEAAILLITHDLGVVAEMAQRTVVMYAGRVMEEGPTRTIFKEAAHPYTQRTPVISTAAWGKIDSRQKAPPGDKGDGAEPLSSAARLLLPGSLPRGVCRLQGKHA